MGIVKNLLKIEGYTVCHIFADILSFLRKYDWHRWLVNEHVNKVLHRDTVCHSISQEGSTNKSAKIFFVKFYETILSDLRKWKNENTVTLKSTISAIYLL